MSALLARTLHATAQRWLDEGRTALLVSVDAIQGSTPREVGARMLISTEAALGTIGGGHLEWQAVDLARHALREGATASWTHRFALGPTLGQCCGGVVILRFEPLTPASLATWSLPPPRFHVELHGAGHVGQALIRLLADLDCTVRWIDERGEPPLPGEALPVGLPDPDMLARLPSHISWVPTEAAEREVAEAPPGACHLVLTHRHDLDLRIITAVLQRGDFAYAGLIGSQTKRARFLHRLTDLGIAPATLARLTCPIGLPEIHGKEPAVLAIAVLAQLLSRPSATHEPP
ncbi:MAG TPA: xanthine dehydrogenase accessory protein XdhC [Aquabacterium sp.]|nr:xanthine dehydrogenase accessory protein XdhC [Aquabacterium sp.]